MSEGRSRKVTSENANMLPETPRWIFVNVAPTFWSLW